VLVGQRAGRSKRIYAQCFQHGLPVPPDPLTTEGRAGVAAAELPAAAHQVESQRRRRHAPQTDGVRGHADVNHRTLATYLNACVENGLTLVPFVFQRPSQA
jgi:hypothetical protein